MYIANKIEEIIRKEVLCYDEDSYCYICQLIDGHVLTRNANEYKVINTGYPYPDCKTSDLTSMLFTDTFLNDTFRDKETERYCTMRNNLVYYRPKLFKFLVENYTDKTFGLSALVAHYFKLSYLHLEKEDDLYSVSDLDPRLVNESSVDSYIDILMDAIQADKFSIEEKEDDTSTEYISEVWVEEEQFTGTIPLDKTVNTGITITEEDINKLNEADLSYDKRFQEFRDDIEVALDSARDLYERNKKMKEEEHIVRDGFFDNIVSSMKSLFK